MVDLTETAAKSVGGRVRVPKFRGESRCICAYVACGLLLAPATLVSAPVSRHAPAQRRRSLRRHQQRNVARPALQVPLRLLEELTTEGQEAARWSTLSAWKPPSRSSSRASIVIPVGSPAVGEITDVRNKGMWGKSGHLGARVLYVTVNGRQIRLSGAFDDKGVAGGIGAVAVSAMIFLPAGFFMTGTSAQVPVGAAVKGFVDEDVALALRRGAPRRLTVSAPPCRERVAAATPAAASVPVNVSDRLTRRKGAASGAAFLCCAAPRPVRAGRGWRRRCRRRGSARRRCAAGARRRPGGAGRTGARRLRSGRRHALSVTSPATSPKPIRNSSSLRLGRVEAQRLRGA